MWFNPLNSGLINVISSRITRDEALINLHNQELGPIAQLRLERTPDKREVTGSTPVRPTAKKGELILT